LTQADITTGVRCSTGEKFPDSHYPVQSIDEMKLWQEDGRQVDLKEDAS